MAEKTLAEAMAKKFHENYEKLAPDYGYKTREESAKPWEDVPVANKGLMIATAGEVLDWLGLLGLHVQWEEGKVVVRVPKTRLAEVIPHPASVKAPDTNKERQSAQNQGFTGDSCAACGGMRVVRNGSCLLCRDCGQTTGCS